MKTFLLSNETFSVVDGLGNEVLVPSGSNGTLALESSIADPFDPTLTYLSNETVTYEGLRYRCISPVETAGDWQLSNWQLETVDEAIQNVISSIPEPDMSSKLDSVAAAPDFLSTATYFVNDFVTHDGKLYQCISAVTTAGEWNPSNWAETDMTSPDATLDITNAGKLRLVGADGSILWQEGYDLGVSSTTRLSSGAVNLYAFAENDMAAVSLILPTVPSGKVGDFVLDVVSPEIVTSATSYTSVLFSDSSTYNVGDKVSYDSKFWECFLAVETAGAWTGGTNWLEDVPNFEIPAMGNSIEIVVPSGEDLNEMLSFEPGTMCELYFTQTAFNVDSKPTWKIVRQDVEDGGAS